MSESERNELHTADASWGFHDREVLRELNLSIRPGTITAIVGPNGCGKSTLLHGLSRLLRPTRGRVVLDGADIARSSAKEVARRMGMLGQSSIAPDGITVADLVSRGRYPHQSALQRWSPEDEQAVVGALEATHTLDLAERRVDELSGGQRQRVWIALVLAQQTPIILLDEPTTFLDIAHQLEVLDLLTDLNRDDGRTVVLVLHDLNQAARYADHLVVLHDGEVFAEGSPADVINRELVQEVFDVDSRVVTDEVSGTPLVLPISRHHLPGDESRIHVR